MGGGSPAGTLKETDRQLLGCLSLSACGAQGYKCECVHTRPGLTENLSFPVNKTQMGSVLSLPLFHRLSIQSLGSPQQNTGGTLSVFPEHVGTTPLTGRFVHIGFCESSSSRSFDVSVTRIWCGNMLVFAGGGGVECPAPWIQCLCLTFMGHSKGHQNISYTAPFLRHSELEFCVFPFFCHGNFRERLFRPVSVAAQRLPYTCQGPLCSIVVVINGKNVQSSRRSNDYHFQLRMTSVNENRAAQDIFKKLRNV